MTPTDQRPPARIIARLDVKAPNLVKGIQLEGLRVIGDPAEHAVRYYEEGIDELIYIDIVASLYERNNLVDLVERTANSIFVPLTVGGGVRNLDDIYKLLRAGADKIALNTGAMRKPELIREASRVFGAQCIVLSVEAKRTGSTWEAFTDNGREHTGREVLGWVREAIDLGVGEVLLTSVDREGTRKGFDLDLIRLVSPVGVPVIACGGPGRAEDVSAGLAAGADAVAIASLLHYRKYTVPGLKRSLRELGHDMREPVVAEAVGIA